MRFALGAQNFGARHAVAAILFKNQVRARYGFIETWPAGARFELGRRAEKRQMAGRAVEHPRIISFFNLASKRPFGAFLAHNRILLGRKQFFPFDLGFLYFLYHGFRSDVNLFLNLSSFGFIITWQ